MLRRRSVAPTLAALLAGAGLAACADVKEATRLGPKGAASRSPVAPAAALAAARDYPYPKFRDIPARPTDVRPAAAWKAAVVDMVGERRALKGWTAANPSVTEDTASYVAAGRAAIPADIANPPAGQAESTEAFAARMRAESTPPPPPK